MPKPSPRVIVALVCATLALLVLEQAGVVAAWRFRRALAAEGRKPLKPQAWRDWPPAASACAASADCSLAQTGCGSYVAVATARAADLDLGEWGAEAAVSGGNLCTNVVRTPPPPAACVTGRCGYELPGGFSAVPFPD
jgi:hypothetical protein